MNWRPSTLEELLVGCAPRTRALVNAARDAIVAAVPSAIERFRPGWGLIGYNAPRYFAFIHAEPDHVRLGFEWGAALEDPAGLLTGDGRQVRYVGVTSRRDLQRLALVALVRRAAAYAPPPRG